VSGEPRHRRGSPNGVQGLTPRMLSCRDFIVAYQREHDGVGPSYDEIAAGLGLRAKSNVVRLVDCLESRGHVRRGPAGSQRSLAVLHTAADDIAAEHMAYRLSQGWGLFRIAEEAGQTCRGNITEADVHAAVAKAWVGIQAKLTGPR